MKFSNLAKFLLLLSLLVPINSIVAQNTVIVATIDNQVITKSELSKYKKFRAVINEEAINHSQAIKEIIERELIFKTAKNYNISIPQAKINSQIENISIAQKVTFNKIKKNKLLRQLKLEVEKNAIWKIIITELIKKEYDSSLTDMQVVEILESIDIFAIKVKLNLTQYSIIYNEENIKKIKNLHSNFKNNSKYYKKNIKELYPQVSTVKLGWITQNDINKDIFNKISKTPLMKPSQIIINNNKAMFFFISSRKLSNKISKDSMKKAITEIEKDMIYNLGNKFLEDIKRNSYIEIY